MKHNSIDYKITAVNYYLVEDKTQEEVCKIFSIFMFVFIFSIIKLYIVISG